MKKKQTEKEWRNDLTVYKVAFWVLVFHLLILAGVVLFSSTHIVENYCNPCDYILSTPSWLVNGKLVSSGYLPEITTEAMIENNITFVYRDGCGWCDKQKESLNMEILILRGLVLKC